MASIFYKNGDATNPYIEENETHIMICHICNNLGRWGTGFTSALDKKWNEPRKKYIELITEFNRLNKDVMGAIIPANVEDNITVMNMVAQDGVKGPNNPTPINYKALEIALSTVTHNINSYYKNVSSIHMPKIGAGLAGGDWNEIEPMIQKQLVDPLNIDINVYEINSKK